jgi:hypothetical protein
MSRPIANGNFNCNEGHCRYFDVNLQFRRIVLCVYVLYAISVNYKIHFKVLYIERDRVQDWEPSVGY